ncbi:hypothetical protein CEXT_261531 [Caerostris extrusa]|uniref:Uncharacterized protein n=1 Tax=Caerostris extrusa TaxID=172846 RepID=A0AAV4SP94_CAEEX|nr:hypothetical protein CEXT_261531 [Caerostris extrusa]
MLGGGGETEKKQNGCVDERRKDALNKRVLKWSHSVSQQNRVNNVSPLILELAGNSGEQHISTTEKVLRGEKEKKLCEQTLFSLHRPESVVRLVALRSAFPLSGHPSHHTHSTFLTMRVMPGMMRADDDRGGTLLYLSGH